MAISSPQANIARAITGHRLPPQKTAQADRHLSSRE
jgi:hypothetical protein